jgi:drug/metabolite transporter (DMT)-like permease
MRPSDLARLALLGTIWGSSFLLISVALKDLSPIQIVGGRILVAALTMVAIARARRLKLPSSLEVWRALLVVAVISNIVPFTLIAWGQERIPSGLAAILNSTTPLFTAVIAAFFLPGERLRPIRAAGIALGFVGVIVIVGLEPAGGFPGQLAVVAAAAAYAGGFVYVRRRLSGRGSSAVTFSAGQMIAGSALIAVPTGIDLTIHPPTPRIASVLAVVVLGALGSGIAYVIYYRLIEDVGATSASFVTYLIPVVGVALGHVFLEERLRWNTFVGAALVICGISIAERAASHRRV